jgi:hypothetical protein
MLAPIFRHIAVESANYPRHFFFSRVTFQNGIAQSRLVSMTSIIQVGAEPAGTRVAIQPRYEWREVNLWEVSMGTVLAVTQQQSTEAATQNRARIRSTDRCPRCGGLMVAEWCEDLSDYTAQRCVQCGEVLDPVILQNRRHQFLFPIEVDVTNSRSVSR